MLELKDWLFGFGARGGDVRTLCPITVMGFWLIAPAGERSGTTDAGVRTVDRRSRKLAGWSSRIHSSSKKEICRLFIARMAPIKKHGINRVG